MRVEILSADDAAWPGYLERIPHDSYHRPAYVRLDARRTQSRPEALVARAGERLFFVPYLVRSCAPLLPDAPDAPDTSDTSETYDAVSPYGYPGMLLNDAGRDAAFAGEAMAALRQALRERGVCCAFLRLNPLLSDDFQTLFPADTFTDVGDTVAIDLSLDETALWKQIREGHQETIKRSARAGFAARFVPLADVVDEVLAVYEQTMDRVKARQEYYFGRDYFAELAQMPHQVHCCVAERQQTIAAACLFLEWDGIVQAHLGGTVSKFLQKSPFHLVLHHATSWAKARGNRWLHLGGGVGGADDRLLAFKSGFSPVRFRFRTARPICDEAKYCHLVELRARAMNTSPEALLASDFFPAYRAM